MQIEMAHAVAAALPLVTNPTRLSESPVDYRRAPPTLGQHTDEVLRDWLDADGPTIAGLRERGMV